MSTQESIKITKESLEEYHKSLADHCKNMSDAYDKIDRFLRNNLDDEEYKEYSEALDLIFLSKPKV